jgi:hypothetical protein
MKIPKVFMAMADFIAEITVGAIAIIIIAIIINLIT